MTSKLPFANKDLGQHFLNDKNLIIKICADYENKASAIVEVGPGPAILTRELATKKLPLILVEKDKRFFDTLTEFVDPPFIIMGDALKVNYSETLLKFGIKDRCWLVSNLPYNISSVLLVLFLQVPQIEFMTLMFQKEVAEKVLGQEKNGMGSLASLTHTYFNVKKMAVVPPGAFTPPPKVHSMVLSFERITPKIPLTEFTSYERFLRILFANRRKQLGSVVKDHELFAKASIDRTRRAETLTLDEVQLLYLIQKQR